MKREHPKDQWLVQTTSDTLNLACVYGYDCDPVELAIYHAHAENPFTDESFADRVQVECSSFFVIAKIGDVTVRVRHVNNYEKLTTFQDTMDMIAAISARVPRYKPQPIEEFVR
jgi:hypothetical protein